MNKKTSHNFQLKIESCDKWEKNSSSETKIGKRSSLCFATFNLESDHIYFCWRFLQRTNEMLDLCSFLFCCGSLMTNDSMILVCQRLFTALVHGCWLFVTFSFKRRTFHFCWCMLHFSFPQLVNFHNFCEHVYEMCSTLPASSGNYLVFHYCLPQPILIV